MAAENRTPAKRASDRAAIAERYLRGEYQATIAAALDIDQSTVSRDLLALQREWEARAAHHHDAWRAGELAKLDELERTYWAAWERSCQERTRSRQGQVQGPPVTVKTSAGTAQQPGATTIRAEVVKEGRDGNPAFLAGVLSTIDRRCKLLGIDAPTKTDLTSDGKPINSFLALVQTATNGPSNQS